MAIKTMIREANSMPKIIVSVSIMCGYFLAKRIRFDTFFNIVSSALNLIDLRNVRNA